jgi:hypothetical protein
MQLPRTRDIVDAGGPQGAKRALVVIEDHRVAKPLKYTVEGFCKSCAGFRREVFRVDKHGGTAIQYAGAAFGAM